MFPWRVSLPKNEIMSFMTHPFEIKVPESGGREEKHRIHIAWSPV